MVCLIKPQFEAGREKVGKKGVVRDPAVHREVIAKVMDFAALLHFSVLGLTWSPIKGPEGNIEYLIFIQKEEQPEAYESEQAAEAALEETQAAKGGISETEENRQLIASIVEQAHETLKE